MKFIPLADFDTIASALNFDTPDCHVTGGCELYTTKAAGSDKKLYKDIDRSLESQHAALLKLGASLSPPQRESMAMSHNLSRSSPFGNLSEISSRRTFAYLIATLNASHSDYDFSHVLRPEDFRRERSLRKVMSNLDSTLSNVRPSSLAPDGAASSLTSAAEDMSASTSPLWGQQMWALLNKEMRLQNCIVFSYQPVDNPFEEEDGAIWAMHYFFFSKSLKRVAYLYVRAVPLLGHSPQLLPRHHRLISHHHYGVGSSIAIGGSRNRVHRRGSRTRRLSLSTANSFKDSFRENSFRENSFKDDDIVGSLGSSLFSTSATKRSGAVLDMAGSGSSSANNKNKRARYWLGDQVADRLMSPVGGDDDDDDDEDDDDDDMDDVLHWCREDDSDADNYFVGDGGFMDDEDVDIDEDDDDDFSLDDSSLDEQQHAAPNKPKPTASTLAKLPPNHEHGNNSNLPIRRTSAMSEDMAATMDL